MQRLLIIMLLILAAGALSGLALTWKAWGWRSSLIALKKSHEDLAGIHVYEENNADLLASGRWPQVVFLGASHTLDWGDLSSRFPGMQAVNRGVGGQLVPQYLLRFRQDALDLHPKIVVIEGCAINATYKVSHRVLMDSYASMAELARLHGIEPILATTMPVGRALEDKMAGINARVREINDGIKEIARKNGWRVVDYYSAAVDNEGFLTQSDSEDGMHCGQRIYDRIAELLKPVLEDALDSYGETNDTGNSSIAGLSAGPSRSE